ncbi:terminase large subunit [Weissella phage PWc]|nr:terminase large subunit [Weissella phage PWc]AUX13501.1 terminase large subunit [Weissella phage PWc]
MSKVNLNIGELVAPAYYPLYTSKARYVAVKGSRGSGKSEAEFLKVLIDILRYPWCNYMMLRRYANTHRKSTFTTFKKVAIRHGVADLFNFNSSMPEITYKATGQKIYFIGADKPESVTSIAVETGGLTHLLVEEAYQIENEEAFDKINDSMRGKVEGYPEAFYQTTVIFNPWSDSTWLKARFFDEETREKDLLSFTTTFRDNPYLDDAFVERMLELIENNPKKARVIANGEWGISEGLIYENVTRGNIPDELRTQLPTAYGLDFGFSNDPTAIIKSYVDFENSKIYIDDEIYSTDLLDSDIYDLLKDRGWTKKQIIADSAEPKSIMQLKRLGVPRIQGAFKGKDSINFGISLLQGYDIVVSDKAPNTYKELSNYVWDSNRAGELTTKPVDKYNHALDAWRYSIVNMIVKDGGRNMTYEERRKMTNN